MVPLLRSVFTYVVYFGTAVLILGTLGFNPMPFLAAPASSARHGFGAESLINDVVSGFFILFEQSISRGLHRGRPARRASSKPSSSGPRIRDIDGRLHIVKNGDRKQVVNYSKDYAMAVVAVEVRYDATCAPCSRP